MTNKDTSLTTGDSYCLQISTNSSLSCESDISSFSFDKEVANYTNRTDEDELPAFEIRLLSPLGRSPSPIDSDLEFLSSPTKSCITPTRIRKPQNVSSHKDSNNEDFVPLHDINAQISPPSDSDSNNQQSTCDSPSSGGNLETIFEGVFLNTPPKPKVKRNSIGAAVKQRNNLLEKIAMNRLNFVPASGDKENCQTVEEDEVRDSKRMTIISATTDDG